MMHNSVTILGCGPSAGVPVVGYPSGPFWGACDFNNPKNTRLRTSAYVIYEGVHFLIDVSPDLRQQLLNAQISQVDAILITHRHADHTHGINDLKPLVYRRPKKQPLPIYSDAQTLNDLQLSFSYLFESKNPSAHLTILQPHILNKITNINGVDIECFNQDHGVMSSLGFRFGSMAYSTDFMDLNDQTLAYLKDLDLWIVDCLSTTTKPTHNNLQSALKWIERVAPKRAILTHMGHELDYQSLINQLPPHIIPAYDGWKIDF